VRWGKVIDQDRCIGCHACSVACKQENGVPLGSFRTWVKYVEKGAFPEVRRHFAVLRCNQCDNPPCVKICPTTAMYRRKDGIVDFDPDRCIGCKSCIQACPYDAIYMDPESQTAAKCHFCAHRVERGLEPACVTACPERALLVGDVDDPTSIVSQIVARAAVRVRKPELGTRPKVFYKGVDEVCLTPDAAHRPRETMWGDGRALPVYQEPEPRRVPVAPNAAGRSAQALVAYDVPRDEIPWGWKISAYLFTKGVGAGALMVGGLLALLRGELFPKDAPGHFPLPAILALIFLGITTGFLVWDLKRPERFLKILLMPQWGSWLVRGAYCIVSGVLVALVWAALAFLERPGPSPGEAREVGLLAILTGIAASGYTAFLFGQARGRAFWQSPLLLPHLVIQAFAAGASALLVLAPFYYRDTDSFLSGLLLAALVLDSLAILSDLYSHVGPEDARQAARILTEGRLKDGLLLGVFGTRFLAFVALAAHFYVAIEAPRTAGALGGSEHSLLAAAGAACTLVGLFAWEHLYVTAGQEPPLS
jgi:Fe-S-cluster-containing dehydrogenase component/formate-dependent nitrite reductase membrane component NrfD